MRFQAAIRQLKKDELAYEAADKAKKALKRNDPRGALSSLDKAVDIQPDEFSFWMLRGEAWKVLGDIGRAERAFTTSISKNPNHYSAYLARGVLLYDNGDKVKGITDIKRSHALLPTAEGSYYLGNTEMEQKNYQRAKAYFEIGAKSLENVGARSRAKLLVLNQRLNPERYIRISQIQNRDGEMVIRLTNLASVSIGNLQIQLSSDGIAVRELRLGQNILPSESVNIQAEQHAFLNRPFLVKILKATVVE
jgi:tetratricopeptide (TPR) repeat protein